MTHPKTIMVLAGGTGTAYHICETIKNMSAGVYLIVCDINPKHLVHSSALADEYIQTPPIRSPYYQEYMYTILIEKHIDILIPLIDDDIKIFSSDNAQLVNNNIFSTAPKEAVFNTLADKKNMNIFLNKLGVVTPPIYVSKELESSREYIIKDRVGYGSRNIRRTTGQNILKMETGKIIQDICFPPEITVDAVNNGGTIFALCRERLEIKAGVCTKARVYYDSMIVDIIKKIAEKIDLPAVFCVQFMKNKNNEWSLIDFNLRPGAGTAMSAAAGFQAVRAALSIWQKEKIDAAGYLKYPASEQYVVRYYREIVTNE